jgi:hypothetical protein
VLAAGLEYPFTEYNVRVQLGEALYAIFMSSIIYVVFYFLLKVCMMSWSSQPTVASSSQLMELNHTVEEIHRCVQVGNFSDKGFP